MTLALITLLHVFVLVFWVGGDLGAYYASYAVADPKQPPAARRLAARLISGIDMAPRTSLVLAFPTGLTLAAAKGWLDPGPAALAAVWIIAALWLVVVWTVHLRDPAPGSLVLQADRALRLGAIAGFAAWGLATVAGLTGWPLFLGVKLLLLAAAMICGVIIRRVLPPFAQAFARVLADPADPAAQAAVAGLLARVRVFVMGIWIFVSLAALVGLWRPGIA
ncbi:MAG: hypothetical protein RLY86_1013 [Pseudomonadota bacterium]|jgi:hypothetical protein